MNWLLGIFAIFIASTLAVCILWRYYATHQSEHTEPFLDDDYVGDLPGYDDLGGSR